MSKPKRTSRRAKPIDLAQIDLFHQAEESFWLQLFGDSSRSHAVRGIALDEYLRLMRTKDGDE
jgi:hypothetical protein